MPGITMAKMNYSVELCKDLERIAQDPQVLIRHRPSRYEKGTVLPVDITGVYPAIHGKAELTVDKFLGGGFAGQVYRCRLTGLHLPEHTFIPGLETGKLYAVKIIIPPTTSNYLNLTKNSSLAVAIGYPDLVSVGNTTLNQTGQALECIAIMMAVYLTISLLISACMNWYNRRIALVER